MIDPTRIEDVKYVAYRLFLLVEDLLTGRIEKEDGLLYWARETIDQLELTATAELEAEDDHNQALKDIMALGADISGLLAYATELYWTEDRAEARDTVELID